MFLGTINHTLDTKGRLIIPQKYRTQLGEDLVIAMGQDGCLNLYPRAAWEDSIRFLKDLVTFNDANAREVYRFYMGGADDTIEMDKQGRILIPASHRAFARLDKELVLVGVGDFIEIWDRHIYETEHTFQNISSISRQITLPGSREV
ncbi:MAG: division/cell wall cluster transcriptional repressor MraZ [Lachnospiraceae bacterium]|nr:division/cell wall cluster transcriptional repressor MraZ [Lachnospiraceae bacterium]